MARVGRFGRLPSKAPDLAMTIVSLWEQYQSQRDQNIEDAWKNGGEFEGEKVTDQVVMDHYRERMKEVTRADPMWDYWHDRLYQVRFTIAEQKANLAYTRSDNTVAANNKMADFYREWSHRLPQNSAAWRDLMTSAARFSKNARAIADRGSASSRQSAYERQYNAVQKNVIGPAQKTLTAVNSALVNLGYDGNISSTGDYSFSTRDVADADEKLAAIEDGPLGPQLLDYLKGEFPGVAIEHLTPDMVIHAYNHIQQGLRNQARIADNYGDHTTAKARRADAHGLATQKTFWRGVKSNIGNDYLDERADYKADLASAKTEGEQKQVIQAHQTYLKGLWQRALGIGDDVTAGSLYTEIEVLDGKAPPSGAKLLWESFEGSNKQSETSLAPSSVYGMDIAGEGDTKVPGERGAEQPENQRGEAEMAQQFTLHLNADLRGLADGSLVSHWTGSRYEAIPRSAVSSTQILMSVPADGLTFTDENGKTITVPEGIQQQAVDFTPVIVRVGNPDVGTGNLPPLMGGVNPFTNTVLGGNEQIGIRAELAGGRVKYSVGTGPDGTPLWSTVQPWPTADGAVQSAGLEGDKYVVSLNPTWVLNQSIAAGGDPAVGSIISLIPDLANPGQFRGQGFFPQNVVGAGEQPTPLPGAPPTPPSAGPPPLVPGQAGFEGGVSGGGTFAAPPPEWDGPYTQRAGAVVDAAGNVVGTRPPNMSDAMWDITARQIIVAQPPAPAPAATPAPPRVVSLSGAGLFSAPGGVTFQQEPQQPANRRPGAGFEPPAAAQPPTPQEQYQSQLQAYQHANNTFYATLVTQPDKVAWTTISVANVADFQSERARVSKLDPTEWFAALEKENSAIATNAEVRARTIQEVSILIGAGQSGLDEASFNARRDLQTGGLLGAPQVQTQFLQQAQRATDVGLQMDILARNPTVDVQKARDLAASPFAFMADAFKPLGLGLNLPKMTTNVPEMKVPDVGNVLPPSGLPGYTPPPLSLTLQGARGTLGSVRGRGAEPTKAQGVKPMKPPKIKPPKPFKPVAPPAPFVPQQPLARYGRLGPRAE